MEAGDAVRRALRRHDGQARRVARHHDDPGGLHGAPLGRCERLAALLEAALCELHIERGAAELPRRRARTTTEVRGTVAGVLPELPNGVFDLG